MEIYLIGKRYMYIYIYVNYVKLENWKVINRSEFIKGNIKIIM